MRRQHAERERRVQGREQRDYIPAWRLNINQTNGSAKRNFSLLFAVREVFFGIKVSINLVGESRRS